MEFNSKAYESQISEARAALRTFESRQMDIAYLNVIKNHERELEFSSSRFFVAGLYGLVLDVYLTATTPIKKFLHSKGVLEAISERYGKKISSIEDMLDMDSDDKKILDFLDNRNEEYVTAIAAYSLRTGKHPYELLSSSKDNAQIIRTTYRNLDAFDKERMKMIESMLSITKAVMKIDADGIEAATLMALDMESDGLDLSQFGIDAKYIGKVVGRYANDISHFGPNLMMEYAMQHKRKMDSYERAIKTQ